MGAAGRETFAARFTLEHHLAAITEAYAAAREAWSGAGPGATGLMPSMT